MTPNTQSKQRIIKAITKKRGMTGEEIAAASKVAPPTCKTYLRHLLDDDLIYVCGTRGKRGGKDIREFARVDASEMAMRNSIPKIPRDPLICALMGARP